MGSSFGNSIRITIFGQSHSEKIGVVIDGLPAGEAIDLEQINAFLARRAPGNSPLSTARKESDIPEVLSGLVNGITCGAPLCAVLNNSDVRSSDYEQLRVVPRPAHADFPAFIKHGGHNDIRGGGHFSARMTAPLCFAGAVCMQLLSRRGITIGAHIASVGEVSDTLFDPVNVNIEMLKEVSEKSLSVIDNIAAEKMSELICLAAQDGDSVGGVIECCAVGLPVGLGEPMFDGVENRISQAVFGIPAVKGIEFGAGFAASRLYGSQNNDPFVTDGETITTASNNHGGVLGGLTSGMPLIFRAAFKPTPSIAKEQLSVDLVTKTPAVLKIKGRHDPCVVPRAVACVEAACAIAIMDMIKESSK